MQEKFDSGIEIPTKATNKPSIGWLPYWEKQEIGAEEIREFIATVSQALEPGFIEPLSEETKKAQKILIFVSLGTLLYSTHALTLAGTIKSNGFDFSVSPRILLGVGLAACLYLEALVAIRSYADWSLYKVKNSIGERQLKSILNNFRKEGSQRPFSETSEYLQLRHEINW
ncbi:MAG TPA: hypothetical protein VIM60_09900, partial [Edaphobacter sp.]